MRKIYSLVILAALPLLLLPAALAGRAAPAAGNGPVRATRLVPSELMPGERLFVKHCGPCHGPDGRRGLNGAHDLTKSNLNAYGRAYLVQNGMGKMPGFKSRLSPQVIEQIVQYSLTLK